MLPSLDALLSLFRLSDPSLGILPQTTTASLWVLRCSSRAESLSFHLVSPPPAPAPSSSAPPPSSAGHGLPTECLLLRLERPPPRRQPIMNCELDISWLCRHFLSPDAELHALLRQPGASRGLDALYHPTVRQLIEFTRSLTHWLAALLDLLAPLSSSPVSPDALRSLLPPSTLSHAPADADPEQASLSCSAPGQASLSCSDAQSNTHSPSMDGEEAINYPVATQPGVSMAYFALLETLARCHRSLTVFLSKVDYLHTLIHHQATAFLQNIVATVSLPDLIRFQQRQLLRDAFQFTPLSYPVTVAAAGAGSPSEGSFSCETVPTGRPVEGLHVSAPLECCKWQCQLAGQTAATSWMAGQAALTIPIVGTQTDHLFLTHAFRDGEATESQPPWVICCRAKQFCSFIVLLGRLNRERGDFSVLRAMIVKNKDQVLIPLAVDPLPSESTAATITLPPPGSRVLPSSAHALALILLPLAPNLQQALHLQEPLTRELRLMQDVLELTELQVSAMDQLIATAAPPAPTLDIFKQQLAELLPVVRGRARESPTTTTPATDSSRSNSTGGGFVEESDVWLVDAWSNIHQRVLHTATVWQRVRQPSFVSRAVEEALEPQRQLQETHNALALLASLARGSRRPLQGVCHTVALTTQLFSKSVLGLLLEEEVNPLDSVERASALVVAAATGRSATELVNPEQLARMHQRFPDLFAAANSASC